MTVNRTQPALLVRIAALVGLLPCLIPAGVLAQQPAPGQRIFPSAPQAAEALISAANEGDMDSLLIILGPDGRQLLDSGDPVADRRDRQWVVEKAQEMTRLVQESDKSVTIYLGAENWPFPIPLISRDSDWFFDTAGGKDEILFRRIGANEIATVQTCQILADAENEYANTGHGPDGAKQFAAKIVSDQGQKNGLYWAAANGEPESPIGPLVAQAAAEGYRKSAGNLTPFHGYIYRMITRQGPGAPGGAQDYQVDGKLVRGFAVLAYPAEYRNSGVMTFMVAKDGIVYQKDLGQDTASIAQSISQYNPDKSWSPVD